MVYPNLKAEMRRFGITAQDLADGVGVHRSGMYLMLQGKRSITLAKATTIRDKFFPSMTLDYLFGSADQKPA